MSISLGNHNITHATNVNVVVTTTGISVSAGSSIYVSTQVSSTMVGVSMTDNQGHTFTKQASAGNFFGSLTAEIWNFDGVSLNNTNSYSISYTVSGPAGEVFVEVAEIINAATPSIDGTNSTAGNSSLPSVMITSSQSNDVAILSVAGTSGISFTADNPPTSPDNTVDFVIDAGSGGVISGADLGSGSGPGFTSLGSAGTYTLGARGSGGSFPWAAAIVSIKAQIVCLLADTEILMQDGSLKKIQEIERSDVVKGDLESDLCYPVSKVCKQPLNSNTLVNLIKIKKDALGLNCPNHDLYITENHPIFYNDKRRPAKCFQNLPGVEFLQNISISELCTDYSLYDLQFDVEGSYVANYLQVQSRSPFSVLTPLARDLYLDDQLYQDDIRVWDSYDHVKELDLSLL